MTLGELYEQTKDDEKNATVKFYLTPNIYSDYTHGWRPAIILGKNLYPSVNGNDIITVLCIQNFNNGYYIENPHYVDTWDLGYGNENINYDYTTRPFSNYDAFEQSTYLYNYLSPCNVNTPVYDGCAVYSSTIKIQTTNTAQLFSFCPSLSDLRLIKKETNAFKYLDSDLSYVVRESYEYPFGSGILCDDDHTFGGFYFWLSDIEYDANDRFFVHPRNFQIDPYDSNKSRFDGCGLICFNFDASTPLYDRPNQNGEYLINCPEFNKTISFTQEIPLNKAATKAKVEIYNDSSELYKTVGTIRVYVAQTSGNWEEVTLGEVHTFANKDSTPSWRTKYLKVKVEATGTNYLVYNFPVIVSCDGEPRICE